VEKYKPEEMVIWQDDALLVINKPSGLLSLPDGYNKTRVHLRKLLEPSFGRLWIVHRLDRGTSGVIVLARSPEVHKVLNDAFAERRVKKSYHAIIRGNPEWKQRDIKAPLLIDGDRKHRTVVDYRMGRNAFTQFRVLERYMCCTLVEAKLHTGRRHQIRTHLAYLGYHLVGDVLYGADEGIYLSELKNDYVSNTREEKPLLGRLGLHARRIVLQHPVAGADLVFEAPYAHDFRICLKHLRKYT
jgi:RluA family pseudouridine synthase